MPDGDKRPFIANLDRRWVFRIFFFTAFLFFIYQILRILSPFVTPLIVAGTITLIFYPLHTRIHRLCRERRNMAAFTSTFLLLAMVILPTILLLWVFVNEATDMLPWAQERIRLFMANPEESLNKLPSPLLIAVNKARLLAGRWDLRVEDLLPRIIGQVGSRASDFSTVLIRNAVFLIFDILVVGFSLFFLFRDGSAIVRWLVKLVPMEDAHKEHILTRLDETLSAVVRGLFITAVVQGLLAGIAYVAAGLKFSVLLGVTTTFMALIPLVGAAGVWIPVGLFLLLQGATVEGVLLLLWGVAVVSMVDNFLRPILIGSKAKLPIFLLFFGTLGGLQVYGFLGILIGPVMIAGALAFARIYQEQMRIAQADKSDASAPPP
jgi:predicted PurR-regulated permease PerM